MWITHGINWEVLTASVQGVAILVTTGMAVAGASAGEEGALAGQGPSVMAEEGGLV